jgi:hypothetical protein
MSKFEYSKVSSRQERKESASTKNISKRASVKIDMTHVTSAGPSNLDFIRGSERG